MKRRMMTGLCKTFTLFLLSLVGVMMFTASSFALKPLGSKCTTHQECTSGRCDNRPLAGCVPQDGTGNSGEFCSTHQQCRTGLCSISQGRYTGVCSGGNRALGQQCTTHQECRSGRCDNRPGSGCVPQDGTGNTGDFCSTHQQCRSQLCTIASGKFTGQCAANNKPLGSPCSSHGECISKRCDNRPGAGCVSQDGAGKANDFCTTHQQCRSGYCQIISGLRGTCSAGDQGIGKPCHVSSECASKYCDKGVCAQPKSSQGNMPPASTCPGGKSFQGFAYVGQPSCAGVMGGYLQCDARGYFCCASSSGAKSPRCGGTGKYEYQPGCSQYSSGGGSNIGPLLRDGIFYGCYKPVF
ncbi:MAG TPA: hypothetical protein PLR60_15365 [Syntrophorhabdaceae bacterium]|nr:hypothetical protein [Syntrophorhabdaceae bacterium]